MQIAFNYRRAEELGAALRRAGELPSIFMRYDPQYRAVEEIYRRLGLVEGALYTIGVALISYMLSTRGEEHWGDAARYASLGYPEGLIAFTEKARSTALYRRAKATRIRKYIREAAPLLAEKIGSGTLQPGEAARILASRLRADPASKTIVFAAKMLYYLYAAAGVPAEPPDTPIPVDYRVSLVTLTSGVASHKGAGLRVAAREIRSRYREEILKAWDTVSRVSGIPPALLDNIVWVTGRCVDEHLEEPEEIARCLLERVPGAKPYLDVLSELWLALGGTR